MVPFECCTQLQDIDTSFTISSEALMKKCTSSRCGSKKAGSRRALRRLMKACWTHPPLEINRLLSQGTPSLHLLPDDVLLECLARLPRPSLQNAMLVCQKWRSIVQAPEFYEQRWRISMLEPLLFVFGGSGSGLASAVYCTRSGKWRAASVFSPQVTAGNEWLAEYHGVDHAQSLLHAQPAVLNHRIFIVGAIPSHNSKLWGPDSTIMYDSWTKTLCRRAPMLVPRKKFACCAIDGRILVAGGANRRDPSRDALMDAEEYIPEENLWRPLASMPRKRYGCLGVAVNGIFYVVGGLKSSSVIGMCMQPYTYISSMDLFDSKTNTWQKTKSLPTGGCVVACTVVGSCIYMLSSHAVELSFWNYDTQQDMWSRIRAPPIPSPLRLDNRLKFSCVTVGKSVYIIQVGGSIDDLLRRSGRHTRGLKEGLVLIYDTLLQEWSRGSDLPSCIKNGAACAVVHC
ncbi:hypothetical protein GOP47_0000727 [Adiantum capillus-veneris]|uniref:F-box domain-containing protein n=1 Tax=Adiantum capillus-veneris TaxID=13818 RepID=A0A9D4VFI6_ADICA|nr:hypothetical protein GOP47_0000727 [Adiantum capillus-veneris]